MNYHRDSGTETKIKDSVQSLDQVMKSVARKHFRHGKRSFVETILNVSSGLVLNLLAEETLHLIDVFISHNPQNKICC